MGNRIIRYAVDPDTGLVWSRVAGEVAGPVLQWGEMLPENNFAALYELERFSIHAVTGAWVSALVWTRKIPIELKNLHRKFWGFKPLSVPP